MVSEGRDDRVETAMRESEVTRDVDSELTRCLSGIALPSKEVLLTLVWALKVEQRKMTRRSDAVLVSETGALDIPTKNTIELKAAGMKRRRPDVGNSGSPNKARRYRLSKMT